MLQVRPRCSAISLTICGRDTRPCSYPGKAGTIGGRRGNRQRNRTAGFSCDGRRKVCVDEAAVNRDCKHVIGKAAGIRGVLLDPQVRFVVQEVVEYVRRTPHLGVDYLGMEWDVPIRPRKHGLRGPAGTSQSTDPCHRPMLGLNH
jgi:hypothetical protein